MKSIAKVEIYLEFPENTPGNCRISSVISYDCKGNEIKNYQELVDNTEFNESDGRDCSQEIIDYVALKVGVSKNIVEIKNNILV